jgi:hypothetical protein
MRSPSSRRKAKLAADAVGASSHCTSSRHDQHRCVGRQQAQRAPERRRGHVRLERSRRRVLHMLALGPDLAWRQAWRYRRRSDIVHFAYLGRRKLTSTHSAVAGQAVKSVWISAFTGCCPGP